MFLRYATVICGLFFVLSCSPDAPPAAAERTGPPAATAAELPGRWPAERARAYVADRPLPLGANYNPRSAINQLEMWQAATFDPAQIDEELGWAAAQGMNSMRVYLHNLVWEADSTAYAARIDRYLDIADRHGISTTFVLFDAVWDPESALGPQPAPRPRLHNSGWVQSPTGAQLLSGADYYPAAKRFVQGVLRRFADDPRVYMWDLYNEPDNHNFGKFPDESKEKADYVFPLLARTFGWARAVNPSQPLTAGVWYGDLFNRTEEDLPLNRFNAFQLNNSDVISYHHYRDTAHHRLILEKLSAYGRPLVCTEYIARTHGSTFATTLPLLDEYGVGAYNWGLVAGKTNTIYPWASWDSTFTAEPHLWHHDVFRPDGSLYQQAEGELLRASGARRAKK